MPRGGSKPGERRGGRVKGVRNRKNADRVAKAAASGLMPAEVMLLNMRHALEHATAAERVARDEAPKAITELGLEKAGERLLATLIQAGKHRDFAQTCARDVAPYFHAKLASIEHTGKDGGPLTLRVVRFSELDGEADAGDHPTK